MERHWYSRPGTEIVLVGVARSFSDFAWVTYQADLAVDREYQGQGIGRELVRRTLERAPGTDCVLRSSVVAMDFYPHLGFRRVENGWYWPGREGQVPPRSPRTSAAEIPGDSALHLQGTKLSARAQRYFCKISSELNVVS